MGQKFSFEVDGQFVPVECFFDFISVGDVPQDPEKFLALCAKGCPNYGKCYSCPPDAPSFEAYVAGCENLLVFMFCANLEGVRADFGVIDELLASKVDGIMRRLEKTLGGRHIAARNCSICAVCKKQEGRPCAHPEEVRNCAVSLGIDCERLTRRLFGKSLSWRKGENSPKYLSFVCALPINCTKSSEELYRELKNAFY